MKTAVNYLTESPQKRPLHRASKEAAQLLLSRVYLYMQDWHNAALTAEELLKEDTRLYHMSARDSARIFLSEDNTEVLFSQGSMNFYNGMTGNRGDFAVSDSLVQLYDQENDYRRYFSERTRVLLPIHYNGNTIRSQFHTYPIFTRYGLPKDI